MNFRESLVRNYQEDLETKKSELEEIINSEEDSDISVDFLQEQIDELQDFINELTT